MAASTADNLIVLYEDNHIIAVNKRPGDIVQGDKTGDKALSEVVKDWLRKKYNKPGNIFAGVVHRLDRPVSGLVVLAKTSKALSRLNEQFKEKEVRKKYLVAVCNAPPKTEDRLVHLLVKDEAKNKSRVAAKGTKGAKEAILTYRLIGRSNTYYFLEVMLETGRHHQIRVQLAALGCAIKGDLKYGAPRSNKDASIHLHAAEINFTHPVKKEPIKISAPPPQDPVWDAIREVL